MRTEQDVLTPHFCFSDNLERSTSLTFILVGKLILLHIE